MRYILMFLFFMLLASSLLAQEKKTAVAVIEFQSNGTLEKTELNTLSNRFRGLLTKTQQFQVIELESMNEILRAKDFNVSDVCNTVECAIQAGKLLEVGTVITGNFGRLGETYTVDLRLIDAQSGTIVQNEILDYQGKIDGLLGVLKNAADNFAGKAQIQANNSLTYKKETNTEGSNNRIWNIIGGAVVVGAGVAILMSGEGKKGTHRIPDPHLPPLD